MTAIRLNPLDASWLYTESRATPMHVGALLPFKLPDGAPKDFGRRLIADLKKHPQFVAPWNRRLKSSILKMPIHYWVEDDEIDLEAHLRHAALPHPGGERELGELIARLHSQPLDLSRPFLCSPPSHAAGRKRQEIVSRTRRHTAADSRYSAT